jgi:hypothetical protein
MQNVGTIPEFPRLSRETVENLDETGQLQELPDQYKFLPGAYCYYTLNSIQIYVTAVEKPESEPELLYDWRYRQSVRLGANPLRPTTIILFSTEFLRS